jgi:hypothetical protein
MTLTGAPVTLSLFHWIAETGSKNTTWFQSTHNDHIEISRLFDLGLTAGMADTAITQQFLKWLGVLVLSFDGGAFSANLSHFSVTENELRMQWDNGTHQTISINMWNHATRKTIDYIMNRACSLPSFCNDIPNGLPMIGAYLRHNLNDLQRLIAFSDDKHTTHADAFEFYAMSAAPEPLLQLFYLEFSECLPDHIGFDGQQTPLTAKAFFSKPVSNVSLLIDKVKMHYNLMHHAAIDDTLKRQLNEKTTAFLSALQKDPAAWPVIQKQMDELVSNQLRPRADFVAMVLDIFWKT